MKRAIDASNEAPVAKRTRTWSNEVEHLEGLDSDGVDSGLVETPLVGGLQASGIWNGGMPSDAPPDGGGGFRALSPSCDSDEVIDFGGLGGAGNAAKDLGFVFSDILETDMADCMASLQGNPLMESSAVDMTADPGESSVMGGSLEGGSDVGDIDGNDLGCLSPAPCQMEGGPDSLWSSDDQGLLNDMFADPSWSNDPLESPNSIDFGSLGVADYEPGESGVATTTGPGESGVVSTAEPGESGDVLTAEPGVSMDVPTADECLSNDGSDGTTGANGIGGVRIGDDYQAVIPDLMYHVGRGEFNLSPFSRSRHSFKVR